MLRERDVPVELKVVTETTPATSEVERPHSVSVRQFAPCDVFGRSRERFESFRWPTPRLDPAVVLLDVVVQILAGSHPNVPALHAFPSKFPQRHTTRHVTVERDSARKPVSVRGKGLARERLGRCNSAITTQQRIYRVPVVVDGSIQVMLPSPNADVRLVGAPSVGGGEW